MSRMRRIVEWAAAAAVVAVVAWIPLYSLAEGILASGTTNFIGHCLMVKTDGTAQTGLVYNSMGLWAYYVRPGSAETKITLVSQTVTGAYSSGGFVEQGSNCPGDYRIDVPDAAFAAGVPYVDLWVVYTGCTPTPQRFWLSPAVNAVQCSGTALTARDLGASVLISSGTGTGQLDVTSGRIKADTVYWNGKAVATPKEDGTPIVTLSGTQALWAPAKAGDNMGTTTSLTGDAYAALTGGAVALSVKSLTFGTAPQVDLVDTPNPKTVTAFVKGIYDAQTADYKAADSFGAALRLLSDSTYGLVNLYAVVNKIGAPDLSGIPKSVWEYSTLSARTVTVGDGPQGGAATTFTWQTPPDVNAKTLTAGILAGETIKGVTNAVTVTGVIEKDRTLACDANGYGTFNNTIPAFLLAKDYSAPDNAGIAAIKLTSDKLDTTLEANGKVYRFTSDALGNVTVAGVADWTPEQRVLILKQLADIVKLVQGGK